MTKTWITGLGLVLGLAGCRFDEQQTKLQYMPDMADAPTVKPQESFLNPPDGAVSMSIGDDGMIYPATFEDSDALAMPDEIRNDPDAVKKGELHYTTYCAICHAGDGRAKGNVVEKYMAVADLTEERFKNYTDGEIFYRITFGTPVMPAYGYALDIDETWQIVRYVRELQQN